MDYVDGGMIDASHDPRLRWLLPPFVLFLFLGHLLLMLLRPEYPLGDPGTPWHFKWGQMLVEGKSLPSGDPFSHTMTDAPWVNYQWLFQVFTGLTQWVGGIPLTTAVMVSLYALVPVLLYQRMLREGIHLGVAFPLAGLAWFVMTMHALVRPHTFTYLFFALLIERLYRVFDGEVSWNKTWWIPLMFLFWANLHGGFSVGLMTMGLVGAVGMTRWLWMRWRHGSGSPSDLAGKQVVTHLFYLGLACGLVTLINPYGIGLHFHILSFLKLDILARWQEFNSPDFYSPSGNIRAFEWMILGIMVVFFCRGSSERLKPLDLILCLFFLHFALQSNRHIMLFVIVATPVLARGIDAWLSRLPSNVFIRRGYEMTRDQAELRSGWVYIPLVMLAYAGISLSPLPVFEKEFYGQHLSRETADLIRSHPDRFRRMFNTDNVGGALIYYFGPEIKVFADDRADFYWQEFFENEYFKVRFVQEGWQEVLNRYGVDSIVLNKKHPLRVVLTEVPHWHLVHEDKLNAVYWRVLPDETRQSLPAP